MAPMMSRTTYMADEAPERTRSMFAPTAYLGFSAGTKAMNQPTGSPTEVCSAVPVLPRTATSRLVQWAVWVGDSW